MCNLGSMFYKTINILFGILFSVLMIPSDMVKYNFTYLLNQPIIRYWGYLVCILGAYLLYKKLTSLVKLTTFKKARMCIFLLFTCMLLSALLPYHDHGDLLSQLHLLFALLSFLLLHRLLFEFRYFNRKITYFYLSCLFLSFLFVITFQSITGISEYIFVMGLWISFLFI